MTMIIQGVIAREAFLSKSVLSSPRNLARVEIWTNPLILEMQHTFAWAVPGVVIQHQCPIHMISRQILLITSENVRMEKTFQEHLAGTSERCCLRMLSMAILLTYR
jgi:hypothetical protein